MARMLDAYCERCDETRRHKLDEEDPTRCVCIVCGSAQQTYEPVTAGT